MCEPTMLMIIKLENNNEFTQIACLGGMKGDLESLCWVVSGLRSWIKNDINTASIIENSPVTGRGHRL